MATLIYSFPCGSADKESACNAGDLGSIPGLGRFPGERKGYPLLYSGLESSMDCIVHEVAQRWTRLSNFHFHLVAQIVKKSACNAGDLGSIPGSGRSLGEGHGDPLQHSFLKNSTDKGAWRATVHGTAKSQI